MFEGWKSIFYAFQEDTAINDIYQLSKDMMASSQAMFKYSVASLRNKESLAEKRDIPEEDKKLNALEAEVRKHLFIYLTIDRAVKNHRAVLVTSLISHDIERIGDYSKNIYYLGEKYQDSQKFGKFDGSLSEIESELLTEFDNSVKYFQDFDEGEHKSASAHLTSANEKIEALLRELQDSPENSGLDTKVIISLVLYLRFLKRISSHLRNVATSYYNPVDRIGFKVEEEQN